METVKRVLLASAWSLTLILLYAGCSTPSSTLEYAGTNTGKTSAPSTGYFLGQAPDDSGMWLLPQIRGPVYAELAAKGLKVPAGQIYRADSPTLNRAIVRVNIGGDGGGTGSFVSDRGLILTNHHIAYDALAGASTPADNLLENGFYARNFEQEIPAAGYTLYIPIEQTEVTERLRRMIPDSLAASQQVQYEQFLRNQIIMGRKNGDDDLAVEIDDYWAGNRQFMSVYRIIRDVRLVHAPPSSIGKYGGDIDNWQWPRHTGDYGFLRAYVAPDGSGRTYHEDNVPFRPSRHLQIETSGVEPGDFTMTLGFPGTTYRYQSSYAFRFYRDETNPVTIRSYRAILKAMDYAADRDSAAAVENASERASFANSLKYLQGVQEGFEKYRIAERKKQREAAFSEWVENDSTRERYYGRVLSQLEQAFDIATQTGDLLYATYYALTHSALLQIGGLYEPYYEYLEHPDSLDFARSRRDSLLERHHSILDTVNVEAQNIMLGEMLHSLASLPRDKRMLYLVELFDEKQGSELAESIGSFLEAQRATSLAYDPRKARSLLDAPVNEAARRPVDPIVRLYRDIYRTFEFGRDNYIQHFRYLAPARMRYVKGMMEFRRDSTEYPDANFTLRLSGGRVMGYRAADGVYNMPFTTFGGMIAKDTDSEPFDAPQRLEDYYRRLTSDTATVISSRFATPTGHIISNFLTTNDITGGNSGSPVLNGEGRIVGIAFDSNYEGISGDYYYDPQLNRTICVDIRYMLFLMEEYSQTGRLLRELGM